MKIVILIKTGSSRYGLCCKGIYAKEQADSQYLFFRDSNMSLVRNQLLTFVWHPQVQITSSGSVPYLQVGSRVDKNVFYLEAQNAVNRDSAPPQGILVNPIYLPAPHEVAKALVTAFTTPPEQP